MMNVQSILSQMSLEEKIALCSGKGFWDTKGFEEYGIPSIALNDGPHGLRKQDSNADHMGVHDSIPSTCFPAACATACSWDEELLHQIGKAIAEECQKEGTQVLLGPGVNIKRNPLCGRNFEYFSEDPLLAGKLAAAWIRGVESKGVAASLKHYAANNAEKERMTSDSIVDARALREIYLKAFEIAVKEGRPGTVMCAYNKINGTYCSDHVWLLQDILRREWGFTGVVLTDWGAMNDRVKAFQAGLDLEMPGSNGFFDREVLLAVQRGKLTEKDIDVCAGRILTLIAQVNPPNREKFVYDAEAHHALARKVAAESAVLLKNEENLLPLDSRRSVAVIGALAREPRYQGAGSSRIHPLRLYSILDGLDEQKVAYRFYPGYSLADGEDLNDLPEAVEGVRNCDAVVIVAGLPEEYESEGFDRESLDLPHNQNVLINEITKANPHVAVVLVGGGAVTMPWIGSVQAVLHMYLSGQAGGQATADLLTGKITPCGKLTETYPLCYSDVPSSQSYNRYPKQQLYEESIYVGYRYYETAHVPTLFPFGYGLSYTTFQYRDLIVPDKRIRPDGQLQFSLKVKNTGEYDGAEIVQIYGKAHSQEVFHPAKELKAFRKVFLKKGEEKRIAFSLDASAFSYFNTEKKEFCPMGGAWDLLVAAASDDVRLSERIMMEAPPQFSLAVPCWYRKPQGLPARQDFETLLGHKVVPYRNPRKGEYTIDCSLNDMRESFIIRQTIKAVEREIAKGFDGPVDEGNLQFRLFRDFTCSTPLKRLAMMSPDQMPLNRAEGLVDMANGHLLKGIRKLMKKPLPAAHSQSGASA